MVMALVFSGILPVAIAQDSEIDGPWKYLKRRPAEGWQKPDFNADAWQEGFGGFGTRETPGSRVATDWSTDDIWLRRSVDLPSLPEKPALLIHHDEDAEVYINGQQVATFKGFVTEYKTVPLEAQAKQALKEGKNVLAVHCRQTGGGQFIDVHIVDADNVPKLPKPKRPTKPFISELITEWGAKVTPENAWQEYPRPQMVRENWTNLNGQWDYAVTPLDAEKPARWDGKILVPFCLESKLSGVQKLLADDEALWYHRTFNAKPNSNRRLLLNFEAVDYRSRVWVNDTEVGQHVGGNVPFQLDITKAVKPGENHLVVRVEDATGGAQLRGKQVLDPHGIWYTRVSGIWQTVWLEEVPSRHIEKLKISTDAKAGTISVLPIRSRDPSNEIILHIVALEDGKPVAEVKTNQPGATLRIENPKLWSPDSPHLYDLNVSLLAPDGKIIDHVDSYTGIRSVGKTQDAEGQWRLTLNGEILFHWGPLDQGWWPDGLLTPPSDAALKSDVEYLKAAGFNMIRKHIKVEPRRFYYHCDKLGMMLWQDQVSGGANPPWTRLAPNPKDAAWKDNDHEQFLKEFEAMVDSLENHPSIVVWVPFNEAWGQHRTTEVGEWIAKRDPSRIVNVASGGNFWPVGDVVDEHRYPHPGFPFNPERFDGFVKVMGEFGGHGWPVLGHLYDNSRRNWGYGGLPQSLEEYKARYKESLRLLTELKSQGIAAGVYTQTTDVEGEINGLLTYDRKVQKFSPGELKELHRVLFKEKPGAEGQRGKVEDATQR
jgi:beta-galactosidase